MIAFSTCVFSFQEAARGTVSFWFAQDLSAFKRERPVSHKPSQPQAHGVGGSS